MAAYLNLPTYEKDNDRKSESIGGDNVSTDDENGRQRRRGRRSTKTSIKTMMVNNDYNDHEHKSVTENSFRTTMTRNKNTVMTK